MKCEWCDREVPPTRRFCGSYCRYKAWDQKNPRVRSTGRTTPLSANQTDSTGFPWHRLYAIRRKGRDRA